jgi:hypothetical protein
MSKYRVSGSVTAWAWFTVEADSPEEAERLSDRLASGYGAPGYMHIDNDGWSDWTPSGDSPEALEGARESA